FHIFGIRNGGISDDAADMTVRIEKSEHALFRISPQRGGNPVERFRMKSDVVPRIRPDRVVPPHDTSAADSVGQAPERIQPTLQRRKPALGLASVTIQRKLEVIPVILQTDE